MTISKIRDDLYVTDIQSIRTQSLKEERINLVVNMCCDSTADNVGCEYQQFDIRDGEHPYETFAEAVEAVLAAWKENKGVLIHCHAGQSRSVSVAAAALAVDEDDNLNQCYDRIRDVRDIHPSPELAKSAERFVESKDSGNAKTLKDILESDPWCLCG